MSGGPIPEHMLAERRAMTAAAPTTLTLVCYVFVFERAHEGQDLQGVYTSAEKAWEVIDRYPERVQREAAVYRVELDADPSNHCITGELVERGA